MKTRHFFIVLAAVAVLFTACRKDADVISVTGITLNYEELTLIPGDTIALIATVLPDDATNKKIRWTSSDTAVATVNSEGLVTAVANGKATITATTRNGNLSDTCFVTVDYRIKWIGDWDFVVKAYRFHHGYEWWDTIYSSGKISLKDNDGLTIPYAGNVIMIGEDGEFLLLYGWGDAFSGKFFGNDKMRLYYNWPDSHEGGPGGSNTIDGTKKK
jgi:hypothetical protein